MRKKARYFSLLPILLGILLFVPVKAEAKDVVFPEGISIGDINVSGMNVSEAEGEIESYVDSLKETAITLSPSGEEQVEVPAGELGIFWSNTSVLEDVAGLGRRGNVIQRYKERVDLKSRNRSYPIELEFDSEEVHKVLVEKCVPLDRKAVNATLKRENGEFVIVEGQTGLVLNLEASEEAVIAALAEWNKEPMEIELVAEVEKPQGDAETLSKVKDLMGSYTTNYKTSGSARCKNIATGCGHINGVTLYPGEQLSVLGAITPFTTGNGYELAGSYLNGQVVESLGGGICQVSTTLYNAVLKAELQVDERSNHSMIVTYVKPSMDAAIAESSGKDMKFTNNTDYPIYIEGVTSGEKSITFNIYGVEERNANREVIYESEVLETIAPPPDVITPNGGAPIGQVSVQSAHTGYKARLWKIVKENGEEVSREQVNSSSYKATPRTASVGVATADPNAAAMINAAIATGSIDQVKAMAAAIVAAQAAPVVPADPNAPVAPIITEDPGNGAMDG